MLSLEDLKDLAAARTSPAVSIFLPVHPLGREIRQDASRLRNLAREAERLIAARHYRSTVARDIVRPAIAFASDSLFWRKGGRGVALFLGVNLCRCYRVPTELKEEVAVSDHFSLRPLLRVLAESGTFFILAISSARTRVLEANWESVVEVNGLGLPDGVRAIVKETDYQATVLAHPLARRPGWRLRQGMGKVSNAGEDPAELHRIVLVEYLTRVGRVVNEYFSGRNVPVVLAALPDIQGHFRPMVRFNGLLPKGIEFNPEAIPIGELRDRAYELARPSFAAIEAQALDHFYALYGDEDPRAGIDAAAIVMGALYARVDTLFLAEGAELWGRIEPASEQFEIHRARAPDDDDVVDRAAAETLLHGGKVIVLRRDQIPAGGPIAAIFRY
jgi:hypothetical protein